MCTALAAKSGSRRPDAYREPAGQTLKRTKARESGSRRPDAHREPAGQTLTRTKARESGSRRPDAHREPAGQTLKRTKARESGSRRPDAHREPAGQTLKRLGRQCRSGPSKGLHPAARAKRAVRLERSTTRAAANGDSTTGRNRKMQHHPAFDASCNAPIK
jgi:hypothetical protein